MCLLIETETPKRAKKDITCYKVLRLDTYNDGTEVVYTPYQFSTVPKNVINGKKPFIAKTEKGSTITDKMFEQGRHCYGAVFGRAIHTFATKNGAIYDADLLKTYFGTNCIIYKCIIPKDTLYYKGDFGGIKSFASQKIIFKEKVLK